MTLTAPDQTASRVWLKCGRCVATPLSRLIRRATNVRNNLWHFDLATSVGVGAKWGVGTRPDTGGRLGHLALVNDHQAVHG